MTDPNWQALKAVTVPAKTAQGFWTLALGYIAGPSRLRFVVEKTVDAPSQPPVLNEWICAPNRTCTADGDPKLPINPANCLFPEAPPGALIAKIGGSIAGKKDGKLFVVGSYCIVDLDETAKGALFLAMNADPMSSLTRDGQLLVGISQSN